jgi:hypothetical protein
MVEAFRDAGLPEGVFRYLHLDHDATARVIAFLKGPLTMKPGGFVSLGHVKRSEGKDAYDRDTRFSPLALTD